MNGEMKKEKKLALSVCLSIEFLQASEGFLFTALLVSTNQGMFENPCFDWDYFNFYFRHSQNYTGHGLVNPLPPFLA